MQREFFDDPSITRPVLLIYGDDPNDAATLRRALAPLAAGDTDHQVQIDVLPGVRSIDRRSLIAHVAGARLGVTRAAGTEPSFRCALDPATWSRGLGLLEPFTQRRLPSAANFHQYLTSDGPVDWIVATSRH